MGLTKTEVIDILKNDLNDQIIGVIDSDTSKQGKYFNGCIITPLDNKVIKSDAKIIVASSYYKEGIVKNLITAGMSHARII